MSAFILSLLLLLRDDTAADDDNYDDDAAAAAAAADDDDDNYDDDDAAADDDDDDDDDNYDDDDAAAAAAADDDDDDDDVDASRSSPSLASLPAKVVRSAADSRSQRGHIVVVAEGRPSGPVTDTELQRLSSVPTFTPLLHGDPASSRPALLDTRHVLALCGRYQDHLHQNADAVAFDQNALCVRIKEVLNASIFQCVHYGQMFIVVCSVWFIG